MKSFKEYLAESQEIPGEREQKWGPSTGCEHLLDWKKVE